ncbi:hypothetical protein L1987_31033 [Smallanthus sonchifolius]|uniref:Uncharacterized protein n=1 Tax=Smallanthus sonchifolius TaxID=185202 RepID=A0ACB9I765_9ASTR|nr:hypothetical protein L1987_31033 [Smallanthus sonchifolius]
MEMEQRTPLMAKKLCGIINLFIYMVKKGLLKNIPWFEIHMMVKRSTKIAGKAFGNLLLDHQTLTCRPNDIQTTFIAPIEYEFSCSNTPIFYLKRKTNRHRYSAGNGGLHRRSHKNQELTVNSVRKAFATLNRYEAASVEPEKSPLTLLGFGESANVRQLRVTDSPFPVNNTEEDALQVDKAAEEFIKNFYHELKQQKNRAAVEPPSPVSYWKWGQVR